MKSVYDEPFLSIRDAAKHLRLSVLQVRTAVNLDPTTGRPRVGDSAFPHAYKATPGRTSLVRIPKSDIQTFKVAQAGVREDGSFIYDEPYMTLHQAAQHLRLSLYQLRTTLKFEPEDARPQDGSAFPHAYKETPAVNSTIRIPMADIEAYKTAQAGADNLSGKAGNIPGSSFVAAVAAEGATAS